MSEMPGDGLKAACCQSSCVVAVKVDEKLEVEGCSVEKKSFVHMKGVSRHKQ